jgi:nitrogen fixation/metabolism regulation signal transduction histidine kinase
MKIALAVIAALSAVLLFLLATASANTALFARNYPLLIGVNAIAGIALLGLLVVQVRSLWRDYRGGVFGSRLKWRLVVMLAMMAVLPGALVYGVSMQFAVKSIDSWFDVRVDSALEDGLKLGRTVLDTLQSDLIEKGRGMAFDLGDAQSPTLLNRLREQSGIQSATLITLSGRVLANSSSDVRDLLPSVPSQAQLRAATAGRGVASAEGEAATGLVVRALVPVRGLELGEEPRVLQLTQTVPDAIARSAESVAATYRDYQELQLGKEGLKRIYTLTLTFTLTLALFAAVALAFFLAERLARPLLILAEGTQAVAAGDFTPRAALATHDELGVLTQSFSKMTHQLAEARRDNERHRSQLEATSAYLESVLANLSAGVLAFDADFRLRAANRGASAILADDLTEADDVPLAQWPRHAEFAQAVVAGFRERGTEWQQQLELTNANGAPQTLLLRGSSLPGGGCVVVFDDITHVISAQRTAAWGEVARRLAHEIKNPLTPIQLSAERLQMKLSDKLDGASRDMLERSTQTIINQVAAMKNMVNDFRDYAKTPPPEIAPIDFNALVREVLELYAASDAGVAMDLAADLPPVLADPNQLRQVLHNLVKNAREALAEAAPADPTITVATQRDDLRAVLRVADNGAGFAPQILSRAFEPYVTTKAKGTGLGLAIVRKVIDEHHGEIKLANSASGGAEISIKLPLATAMQATQDATLSR